MGVCRKLQLKERSVLLSQEPGQSYPGADTPWWHWNLSHIWEETRNPTPYSRLGFRVQDLRFRV